jgi:hypothetical protein
LRDARTPQSRPDVIDSFSEKVPDRAPARSGEIFLPLAVAANPYLEKAKVRIA